MKRKSTPRRTRFDLNYHVGLFGGLYPQSPEGGLLIDLGLRGRYKRKKHYLDLKLGFERDPFSTKGFNFDDIVRDDPQARIVQKTNDLVAGIAWRAKWRKKIRSKVRASASYRLAEHQADNRGKLRIAPSFRYGSRRGWQAQLESHGEVRRYPHYLVNNRSLDQYGIGTALSIGYQWKRILLEGDYAFSFIQYHNARYDTESDGQIRTALHSKSHLKHKFGLHCSVKPSKKLRMRLKYRFELNNARHYDRDTQGRAQDGRILYKFIRDYYDYRRHRLNLYAHLHPVSPLNILLSGGVWRRAFTTYEARAADNRWLDELRRDIYWESNIEISVRVWTIHGGKHKPTSTLQLVAFASHEQHISNMRRETSFATNYTVTRIFGGVEVTGL